MSKTIILGTLTASAAFALLPLTAATAQPPASWSLVPGPLDRGTGGEGRP